MDRQATEQIQQAIEAAREVAHSGAFDGCDADEIEEIIAPIETELRGPRPTIQTLTTYLNSLAKSLRADPSTRGVCMQIDSAMRNAGIPTHWEH